MPLLFQVLPQAENLHLNLGRKFFTVLFWGIIFKPRLDFHTMDSAVPERWTTV
jgi:hypothetical protein